jgi:hypothetical protein
VPTRTLPSLASLYLISWKYPAASNYLAILFLNTKPIVKFSKAGQIRRIIFHNFNLPQSEIDARDIFDFLI